jgi:hypothetical protein
MSEETPEVPLDAEVPLEEAKPEGARAELERRDFLQRSAQVAAASLFGGLGLDPLIDAVLARMGEMTGARSLADAIAHHLRDSGVIGVADAATYSADCPSGHDLPDGPGPPQVCTNQPGHDCPGMFTCPPAQNFGCRFETGAFRCVWGGKFNCQWGAPFSCLTDFTCPPWVEGKAWFYCFPEGLGTPVFNCAFPDPFACGRLDGAVYLCPDQAKFCPTCTWEIAEWHCESTPDIFHTERGNEDKSCPPPGTGFACDKPAIYSCGRRGGPHEGEFHCSPGVTPTHPFTCNPGDGTQYDFDCANHQSACTGGFQCDTRHWFRCEKHGMQENGGFDCRDGGFTCKAGGDRCGVGSTGAYDPEPGPPPDDHTPGDFSCWGNAGPVQGFRCSNAFACAGMADDFRCYDQETLTFACSGWFDDCQPSGPGGLFVCNRNLGEFACGPGFQCPAGRFSNFPEP